MKIDFHEPVFCPLIRNSEIGFQEMTRNEKIFEASLVKKNEEKYSNKTM